MTPLLLASESLSNRIKNAYRLRQPHWRDVCRSERVWDAAAALLLECRRKDPSMPVDPELFVASQPSSKHLADPWSELASPIAAKRYRRQVRKMIISLRREIRHEVRLAETKVRGGMNVETVLLPSNQSLTALGCFIVAQRAGRIDLARQFRVLAREQHESCPLYQEACLGLIPRETYPQAARKSSQSSWLIPPTLRFVPPYLN